MNKINAQDVRKFFAEMLGTLLLVFLGCMGCIKTLVFENSHFQTFLNFGLVIMIVVQVFSCISGAHVNPAITLAAVIYKKISAVMGIIYFCAQMLGACLGYGLLILVTPKTAEVAHGYNSCITLPQKDLTLLQAVAIEFLITAVVILVMCSVWDSRNANLNDSVAIKLGLTFASLFITAGKFTGASINPARSFAPALWNMNFTEHWIYWVGPMLGSLVASLTYVYGFKEGDS